ncbi:hypothetical protein CFN78_10175 [Amycolatopsis antarctica]|uniref:Copper-transporting ATPase n=1 Tax=Amycolatopsis antarctica TaxID=1854586 RepID=A0A263D414_9PSEU|nr:DUF6541 family protein [Amycolatopsis antarctica]OZM73224.1 hypothetical protein CFN78_10175 [Amycolatopsis antarctica]
MTASDIAVPLVGLLVLVVPGLLLQLAAGVRDKLWLAAMTAPASVGVFVVAGVTSAIPGVSYSPLLVVVVTVVLAAIVFGLARWRRHWAGTPAATEPADGAGPAFLPALSPRFALLAKLGALAFCLVAIVLAFQPWRSGLGGWETYPQEHDTIIHTVLVGFISHTGEGAPWQLLPLDMITGEPVSFYPSGLPLTAALTGDLAGGPIAGFNIVNALMVGPVFVLGCAALTAAVLRRIGLRAEWIALAGGIAAIVAAGLYRPGVNLLHDGGIAPNAVAMSLTPGIIAGIVTLGRSQWLRAAILGLGLAGIFSVHPSVVATVGASVVVFWLAEAFTRQGRAMLRSQWPVLLGAAAVAAVAAAAQVLGSLGQAGRTGSWLPDIPPAALGDAVGTNLMLTYGGYYDSKQVFAQAAAGLLALAGAVAVLLTRKGWAALAMWGFWLLVSIDFKISPGSGFGSTIGSFFYKSYVRVQAHVSVFVPLMAAIAIVFVAAGIARLVASPPKLPAFARVLRQRGPVTAGLIVLIAVGYVASPGLAYEHRNAEIVAQRYAKPEFVRVGEDDRKASEWLAGRVQPGERVMNSANDGSTYAYTEEDVPVVNVVTLGAIQAPYTYALLEKFDDYPRDPQIRRTILDLNIRYVYVDSQAPTMGAGPGAPDNWLGEPTFTVAPGLERVDGLPGISVGFRSGSVTVYELDRGALENMSS